MKQIVMRTSVALLAAAALHAQQPAKSCNNETLKGAYGVIFNGTVPAATVLPIFPSALFPPGTIEQVIGVVVHTFDGSGKFTQTDTVKGSLSGPILDRPGFGTYKVNPDCSGTYSIIIPVPGVPPIVVHFVVVDSGKEFRGIVVSPQAAMTTANGRKID